MFKMSKMPKMLMMLKLYWIVRPWSNQKLFFRGNHQV